MQAGKLDKIFELQAPDDNTGTAGEGLPNYTTVARLHGGFNPVSANDVLMARQQGSSRTESIKIRYHAGLTNDMRLVWRGRYFYVDSILNRNEKNKEIDLLCIERTTP